MCRAGADRIWSASAALNDPLITGVRHGNRVRVLRALLRQSARNRADLSRTLGLSRATVTALLQELEHGGIIEQQRGEEDGPPVIGRPPMQVSLVPGAAYAVGIDFGHAHVHAALCDLTGAIVAEQWSLTDVDDHPLASFDLAQRLTADVLAQAGVARERVIGVGVGLAAPLDASSALVHAEGILSGWEGVRPVTELEARLGLPVQVENDANAGAMGEHLFGAGRGVGDMAYLRLSAGVGLGLILGGRPYGGVSGIAGEIGHTPAVEHGLICRCGNRGCLETVASPDAVAELLSRSRRESLTIAEVLALVERGDRGACRAVADAGEAVGVAIAAMVNLLNPALVIIGGELAGAGDVLLDPVRAAVRRRALAPAAHAVKVVCGDLGDHAEVLGAAAIQLARAPEALATRLRG
jgi:predicted NBD/HSP70 family sugar kinase